MEYPDGTPVSVGDHIWWNEGTCIGFVGTIIEGKEEEEAWGLEEPHILISGYHPRASDDAGYVAYSPSRFADEGIERLSAREEESLDRAVAEISAQSGYREPFLVGVVYCDCRAQAITFSTFDGGKTEEFSRVTLPENGLQNKPRVASGDSAPS